MRDTSDLYFEAHVTMDPVPQSDRDRVQDLIEPFGFRLAKLLMQKGEPSNIDTFCTAHSRSYSTLVLKVTDCVRALRAAGINVRRYKIEDTVIDSRSSDVLMVLA